MNSENFGQGKNQFCGWENITLQISIENKHLLAPIIIKTKTGGGGIRTHASEETGALNQRLRPLGHATFLNVKCKIKLHDFLSFLVVITFLFSFLNCVF